MEWVDERLIGIVFAFAANLWAWYNRRSISKVKNRQEAVEDVVQMSGQDEVNRIEVLENEVATLKSELRNLKKEPNGRRKKRGEGTQF